MSSWAGHCLPALPSHLLYTSWLHPASPLLEQSPWKSPGLTQKMRMPWPGRPSGNPVRPGWGQEREGAVERPVGRGCGQLSPCCLLLCRLQTLSELDSPVRREKFWSDLARWLEDLMPELCNWQGYVYRNRNIQVLLLMLGAGSQPWSPARCSLSATEVVSRPWVPVRAVPLCSVPWVSMAPPRSAHEFLSPFPFSTQKETQPGTSSPLSGGGGALACGSTGPGCPSPRQTPPSPC